LRTGSKSYVITSQFSKLYCIDTLYRPLENLDAIALKQIRGLLDIEILLFCSFGERALLPVRNFLGDSEFSEPGSHTKNIVLIAMISCINIQNEVMNIMVIEITRDKESNHRYLSAPFRTFPKKI
jgi:hypothetical protein